MGSCNSKSESRDSATNAELASDSEYFTSDIAAHGGSILGIVSREGTIASCGDDKVITISERDQLASGMVYHPLSLIGHEKAVNRLYFDQNSDMLFSASRDLSIRLWRYTDSEGSSIGTIPNAHSLNISAVMGHKAHPGRLYSASRDYSVKAWDISGLSAGGSLPSSSSTCVAEYSTPRNIVTALTTCANEADLLYQGSEDLCVRVWDLRQSSSTVPAVHLTGYVYFPLCLDRQQQTAEQYLLASGTKGFNSVGCGIMVWDMRQTSKPVIELKGHSQDVVSVQFSHWQSHLLYSLSKDGSLTIWNTVLWKEVGAYRFDGNKLPSCLTVLQNSNNSQSEEIAVGSMDGSITILHVTLDKQGNGELDVEPIASTAVSVAAE